MGSRGKRREGRRVCQPGGLSHTQDVTHAVWGGRSALFRDFKVKLGFQDDFGVKVNEKQVLTAGKKEFLLV